jgi:DNA-binding NarL/FixJ family response regulator
MVAELCSGLLASDFDVVGVVTDGHKLVRAAAKLKPDLAVVDVGMPTLNGLDAGERVKANSPRIKLVYLTMNPDPEVAAEAFRRGASGYLVKTCAASELLTAIHTVLLGKSYLCSTVSKDVVKFLRWQDKKLLLREKRLTFRGQEVLRLLAQGKVAREVAEILHIKCRTVYFHKYRMMKALGVANSAELIRYAARLNMVA